MKLYDTFSGKKAEFAPWDGHTVRMYVCGVTPYDTTHIGHAMTYLTFDVLNRYCQYLGWRVRYVQNVTDIDDDILKRARRDSEESVTRPPECSHRKARNWTTSRR